MVGIAAGVVAGFGWMTAFARETAIPQPAVPERAALMARAFEMRRLAVERGVYWARVTRLYYGEAIADAGAPRLR